MWRGQSHVRHRMPPVPSVLLPPPVFATVAVGVGVGVGVVVVVVINHFAPHAECICRLLTLGRWSHCVPAAAAAALARSARR